MSIKYLSSKKRYYYPNVFNATKGKRAIVPYLTRPFITSVSESHSNSQEALKIAEILDGFGYVVDVIDSNSPREKLKSLAPSYDLILGIEPNFLYLMKKYPKARKVYYGTGANCFFQNQAEKNRVAQVNKRKKSKLLRRRIVINHKSSDDADGVILIGNDWTKSTYQGHAKKIETVHVSAFSFFPYPKIKGQKNWQKAKKSYLWFGSVGAVHKGLDLLLEIFPNHPELELFICGAVDRESDFSRLYKKELYETKNIHYVGWVSPKSKKFAEIVRSCGFAILPSCSEGMSSSVATCMHAGMIPVVSRECGVDISDNGILISSSSASEIEKSILSLSNLPFSKLARMSKISYDYAKSNFTIEKFESDFKKALQKFL